MVRANGKAAECRAALAISAELLGGNASSQLSITEDDGAAESDSCALAGSLLVQTHGSVTNSQRWALASQLL